MKNKLFLVEDLYKMVYQIQLVFLFHPHILDKPVCLQINKQFFQHYILKTFFRIFRKFIINKRFICVISVLYKSFLLRVSLSLKIFLLKYSITDLLSLFSFLILFLLHVCQYSKNCSTQIVNYHYLQR